MTEDSIIRLHYQRGQATAQQVQSVVDETLAELTDQESDVASRAAAAGLTADQITDARISVTEDTQGIEPVMTTILVAIAINAGTHAAIRLWDRIIQPRIERDLGADALGTQRKDEDENGE